MKLNYNIQIEKSNIVVNGEVICNSDNKTPRYKMMIEAILNYEKCKPLKDGVYNKAVYWPMNLEIAIEEKMGVHYEVQATNHYADRCEQWNVPFKCYTASLYGEIIEAEVYDGVITKIVTRLPNNRCDDEDICFAILLGEESGIKVARVKTVWVNMKCDNHYTINKSNYINEV